MQTLHKLYKILTNHWLHFSILTLIAIFMIGFGLQWLGIHTCDCLYYAEKAKEMIITGNFLIPQFNGYPTLDNPPFFFWMLATCFKLFGINDFSAHIPVAICGVASIILTFFFARYIFVDDRIGILSMFFISSMPFFIDYSRIVMMDVPVALFSLLCAFSFWYAKDKPWIYVLWGFFGACGVLIKSVIGGLTFVVCIIYTIIFDKERLYSSWLYVGIVSFIVATGSWFLCIFIKQGTIAHFEFLSSIVLKGSYGRTPWDYYFTDANCLSIYRPWLWLILTGIILIVFDSIRNDDRRAIFLLCWIFIPIILLSLSSYKSYWYPTFILPACAILCAVSIAKILKILRLPMTAMLHVLFIICGYLIFLLPITKESVMNQVTLNLNAGYSFSTNIWRRYIDKIEDMLAPNQRLVTYAAPARFWSLRRVLWFMRSHYVIETSDIQQALEVLKKQRSLGLRPIGVCFKEDYPDVDKHAFTRILIKCNLTELTDFEYIRNRS